VFYMKCDEIQNKEALSNQNSQNMITTPSTDTFTQSIEKRRFRRPGGQKGHPGFTLNMREYPDEIITYQLHKCKHCGNNLLNTKVKRYEKRQKFDIIINQNVIEYRIEIKKCSYCGLIYKADLPENIIKKTQYGSRVLAIAVYLRNFQLIPYERISRALQDFFGLKITVATIINAENKCFHNLKGVTNNIKNRLIRENVINCDETDINLNGRKHHCHVISTEKLTLYFHHRNRGYKAMKKMGVLPKYRGIVVHDFWKPYFKYKSCEHAVCNVHILRELKEISKNKNQEWALEMSNLLLEIKKYIDSVKKLDCNTEEETIKNFVEKYDFILSKGFESNRPSQDSEVNIRKRGKKAQSDAKNLLDRFSKYKTEVLRFATDLRVPFGNNQAERDIRMTKVQQKISGAFRTRHGADAFFRIRGYISTLMKNDMSVISSLEAALKGEPPIP
jgi:transposase